MFNPANMQNESTESIEVYIQQWLDDERGAKGAYINYEGGKPNFSKKIRSPGNHRPKYFMAL